MEGYLTVQDAAKKANRHDSTIIYAIHKGHIEAVKLGRQWFIKEESLDAYIANPPRPGPKQG